MHAVCVLCVSRGSEIGGNTSYDVGDRRQYNAMVIQGNTMEGNARHSDATRGKSCD